MSKCYDELGVPNLSSLPAPPIVIEYRHASPDDAATLARMNRELIREEGHRNRMTLEELESRMRDFLSGEYGSVLFVSSEQVCGYALYRQEPEWIYLRQFYVVPDFRRRGIGRGAIDWLRKHVWSAAPRIRLDVLVGNAEGIAFWKAVGFAEYCLTMELEPGETD